MEKKSLSLKPLVGVAVIVHKDGKILLGKRKNAHGHGTWALPGGHLEFNESIHVCARREVFEETGLQIKNLRNAAFTNDIFKEARKHYVTLYISSEYESGDLTLKEPEKCEGWRWFAPDRLPEPKFLSLHHLVRQYPDLLKTSVSPDIQVSPM